jgi:hypothetical protein
VGNFKKLLLTQGLEPSVCFRRRVLDAAQPGEEHQHLATGEDLDDGVELRAVADHGQVAPAVADEAASGDRCILILKNIFAEKIGEKIEHHSKYSHLGRKKS